MSRFQSIENRLKSINETVFQELCDSYLKIKSENYLAFSRTGSQTGKQKTTRGTPDSFFLLSNANYIFIETTTNITDKKKLEKDIRGCFDFKKTKIPINKIEEIILCFNWDIDQKEILLLNAIVKRLNNKAKVRYLMLQELAIELHLNHRDLANQYLGIALDTGQIVSMATFIEEYNKASTGISTPLDNTFLHREKELDELKFEIQQNDFVILTGAPGIGKTKLALEGITSFLSENLSFDSYCISYKHHTLLDDLYQYFDPDKDYVLFVDDANRIDAFGQITGFYSATRKGQLKVIITVRDYAFPNIGLLCQDFSPSRIDLIKFTDDQIKDIIKAKPFEILNHKYYNKIIEIANGNPRLAIMTALLVKAEQNIGSLSDVSDLFESYFSTFIKDEGAFANILNIKSLGLIAFFYTIPYKNKMITESILSCFDMQYSEFIDSIDNLEKLELIDIQFDHVKIPEQNFSTFFFYKAFVKDNLLSFDVLLDNFYDKNVERFRDCVIPANNTFGPQNVMEKILPVIKTYWLKCKLDNQRAFKFLSQFWFYLAPESLEFVYAHMHSLPVNPTTEYIVTYDNNDFSKNRNEVIELLGEFFRFPSDHLKDSLTLAFEYIRKIPEHLPELIHKVRVTLTFDSDDERYLLERQTTLFNILVEGVKNNDPLLSISFFELSKTFLEFKFEHTRGVRNNIFSWYHYPIQNTPLIQSFRKGIWDTINNNFVDHQKHAFGLLQSYASVTPDVTKEIMEFDVEFLVDIIQKHLKPDSFEHCKYVQDQVSWCIRSHIELPIFTMLSNSFKNKTYEIFLKIDWDQYRDRQLYDFNDYDDYNKLKEVEIRDSFIFKDINEIKEFYSTFQKLKTVAKNDWNYNASFDLIIDENCTRNFELGAKFLSEVIKRGNDINYVPQSIFKNHLTSKENLSAIWSVIASKEFNHKRLWELSYYDNVDVSLVNQDLVNKLVSTISSMTQAHTIHVNTLKRYLAIEPKLLTIILEVIYEKNEKDDTQLQLWMDFFNTYFDQLGDDLDLIKRSYIQQSKIQSHFDFEGKGFLKILKKDQTFLIDYLKSLYTDDQRRT
ncbi:MAG: hypothetical protein ACI8XB_002641 [Patiriisocius sp.]|jgi:hypothetical protein